MERPHVPLGTTYNHSYYPILLKNSAQRERVTNQLIANGVTPRRYFHPSLNVLPYVTTSGCMHSESAAERVLCLPLYAGLALADVQRISRLISAAL
ncbi:MAG: DegT/DnrJ/EryC1/StrS family aminotransferase [Flavobacteriales bacterium]|nr:DegT/DnrJ/EryC1/StrS family aminotransferase [Flavobacteriales bacterium]